MKSFDRFLGKSAIVLSITLFLSIGICITYAMIHPNLFQEIAIKSNDGNWQLDIDDRYASDYNTILDKEAYETTTIPENIVINSSFEQIIFIEEDRDQIWVEYYREKPDIPTYTTSFDIYESENTLYITTSTQIRDVFMDNSYDGYIRIYVPTGYHLSSLDITSAVSEIRNDAIWSSVDSINITATLGDILLEISSPIDLLVINNEVGSTKLDIDVPINTVDISAAFGDIELDCESDINQLFINTDSGNINILSDSSIIKGTVKTTWGVIEMDIDGRIEDLTLNNENGIINVSAPTDNILFIDSNISDIEIEEGFTVSEDITIAQIKLYNQLGSIYVED